MKNGILVALVLIAVLNALPVFSQQPQWCGSMQNAEMKFQQSPPLRAQFESYLESLKSESPQNSRATNDIIYIPVVFHIVHNGDALGTGENITDAQALSQIDALNLAFNLGDPDLATVPSAFQPLIANCKIKFCIAKFDVNGFPTTGINRYQYSNVSWNSFDDIDNTLKPATIWDPSIYLNIWSVRFGGSLLTDGVLAYATIPFGAIGNDDGVVSRHTHIGTTGAVSGTFNKGKTVVHEVGHWLGLLHTWGLQAGCGGFGDFIDDTPDQYDLNFGCPSFPSISCNNGPNGDLFYNYMDYTSQDCSSMFTLGQSARMTSVLNGVRSSIKNSSSSCYYSLDASLVNILFPNDTVCALEFKPIVTLKNEGTTPLTSGKFYYQIDGGGVQIYNWFGSLGLQGETQITLPLQTVGAGTHVLDVTFGNANGQSSDNFPGNDSKSVSFVAYDGTAAATIPMAEGFENDFPTGNWRIQNPNNDVTWVWNTTTGGYGTSTACVSMNNLSYTFNPNWRKDAFVTDVYDLTTATYPELKFDVAYARYSATRADSLNVYYSVDCGSTWIKVWNQSGTQLATAPDQTTLFTPTAAQWKTVSVPLVALQEQGKVSFKFENAADWGNMLYIDNINIANNPALTVPVINHWSVKVFPNPAGTLAGIKLPNSHPFTRMRLLNTFGQKIWETTITQETIIFSVENLPSGLYLIHLEGNDEVQTEKLIINR